MQQFPIFKENQFLISWFSSSKIERNISTSNYIYINSLKFYVRNKQTLYVNIQSFMIFSVYTKYIRIHVQPKPCLPSPDSHTYNVGLAGSSFCGFFLLLNPFGFIEVRISVLFNISRSLTKLL